MKINGLKKILGLLVIVVLIESNFALLNADEKELLTNPTLREKIVTKEEGDWLLATSERFSLYLYQPTGVIAKIKYQGRSISLNKTIEIEINSLPLTSKLLGYKAEGNNLETTLLVKGEGIEAEVIRRITLEKDDTINFSYQVKNLGEDFPLDTITTGNLSWYVFEKEPNIACEMYGDVGTIDTLASFALSEIRKPRYPQGLSFPGLLYYTDKNYFLPYCFGSDVGFYLHPDVNSLAFEFCYYARIKKDELVKIPTISYSFGTQLKEAYLKMGRLHKPTPLPEWWFHTTWFSTLAGGHMFCLGTYKRVEEFLPEVIKTGANGIVFGQCYLGFQHKGGSGPINYRPDPRIGVSQYGVRGTEEDFASLCKTAHSLGIRIAVWVTLAGLSNEPGSDWKDSWGVRDKEGNLWAPCPARPPDIPYDEIVGFDLANPEVKKYLRDSIINLVKKYDIDYIWLDSALISPPPNFAPEAKKYLRYPGESMIASVKLVDYLKEEVAKVRKDVAWGGEGTTWEQPIHHFFGMNENKDLVPKITIEINKAGGRVFMECSNSFYALGLGTSQLRKAWTITQFYSHGGEELLKKLTKEAQEDKLYLALAKIVKEVGFADAKLIDDNVIQIKDYLIFSEDFKGEYSLGLLPNKEYMVKDIIKDTEKVLKTDTQGNLLLKYSGEGIIKYQEK